MKKLIILGCLGIVSCLHGDPDILMLVKNSGNVNFGSVNIHFEDKNIQLINVNAGDSITKRVFWSLSKHAHDVVYSIKAYKNDSLLLKHIVFSNDLGYYPYEISIDLSDSVTVKEK